MYDWWLFIPINGLFIHISWIFCYLHVSNCNSSKSSSFKRMYYSDVHSLVHIIYIKTTTEVYST